jgi:hypothetical protein
MSDQRDANERIDLVYTWVDDEAPGFKALQNEHASHRHDLNPNRTRDNLDMLKYSLRSACRYAPWLGHVYIVTMRPQRPSWLVESHPNLTVVHHDEIIDAALLPTFNSFSIITHLHKIPGVSKRFLYLADDLLFMSETDRSIFEAPDGRINVFLQHGWTPSLGKVDLESAGPWNMALAHTNALLDARYGAERRHYANHVPFLMDTDFIREMLEFWPEDVARTRDSRFRAPGNIAPPHLYPYSLLGEGLGVAVEPSESKHLTGYVGLENIYLYTAFNFLRAAWNPPRFCTLNDNFDANPNPAVERLAARKLGAWLPDPSPYEIGA